MTPIEHLRSTIEKDIFDYTQLMFGLSDYKKPRDVVTRLFIDGKIIRIRKGLYCFGVLWRKAPVSMETLANIVYGPSALSLDYALSHYGLIPEQVTTLTSVTPGRSRVYNTPVGRFSFIHLPTQFYGFGLTSENTNSQQWLIMKPIKVLADKVWTDKRFQPRSAVDFAAYLFHDLRIDELQLLSCIDDDNLTEIAQNFTTRKIKWLVEFLSGFKSQNHE
jgi:hypothetical protein